MGNAGAKDIPEENQKTVLNFNCTVTQLVDNLKDGKYKNVVVMAGAGISVSCGIPDFRTPGTGLYDNLQRFNLPTPESVFDLGYFQENKGHAFYKLAKEMWPDHFKPSPGHCFVKLLDDKGLLRRCYTQNIDTLERATGVDENKIIEAHGSFASSSCTKCKTAYDQEKCKSKILSGNVPIRCEQAGCGGLVKPNIVFFGENLPVEFFLGTKTDFPEADLLIIMGTSLTVHPFASLIEGVSPECPRLLINMKPVGLRTPMDNGLRLRQAENYRDVMLEGSCDDAVRGLCDLLGWREELEAVVRSVSGANIVSNDIVDPETAFPDMKPGGYNYNWRLSQVGSLPEQLPLDRRTDDFELDELVELARNHPRKMSLIFIDEYSDPRYGGEVVVMLCVTDEAHKNWDESHCIAVVENGSEYDFSILESAETLSEPMHRENTSEEENVAFFQLVLHLPFMGDEFEFWYVDRTQGVVRNRWGTLPVEGECDEDYAGIEEMVKGLAELPAHLQSNSDEDEE